MWVYFWAVYSVPLTYVSVFLPILYCFDDCSFESSLKLGSVKPLALFFFLQIVLIRVFCVYIQILELLILILWKCHWYFDRNESMNCLREYGHFNNFNSSNQWVQYISPLDCVILSFLYQCLIVSWVQVFLLMSSWLGLFLSISLFLMQLNGVVFLNSLSKSLMFSVKKDIT